MPRPLIAACSLALVCGGLALALREEKPPVKPPAAPPRALPGVKPSGHVLLPNQWRLRPAGRQIPLGDFPVNIALHPSGKFAAVLHAGFGPHEVIIVSLDEGREQVVSRVNIRQAFQGIAFDADGGKLYASGGELGTVHSWRFKDGLLSHHEALKASDGKEDFTTGNITPTADGLWVCGTWGDTVRLLQPGKEPRAYPQPKDSYPYHALPSKDGKRLFVSLWGASSLAVLDLAGGGKPVAWESDSHPTEMALTPDGKHLFVSCSNSTRVNVFDTEAGKRVASLNCALHPDAPSGNTPSSLCLTPDGKVLFVANADNNNVAVFNVEDPVKARPMGFLPAGWYPTSVRYNAATKRILVANGKGLASRANPHGPGPYNRPELLSTYQYIGGLMQGTLGVVQMPGPEAMARLTKAAYSCSPLRAAAAVNDDGWTEGNPVPRKIGEKSPIKYVLYVIKENRTYDQVLGDMKEGKGDPDLCLFPEKVTPNHHRLARQFVLLDNFYVEGEVSADGHEWTMGAYATDFVEKVWPLGYRGQQYGTKKMSFYPAEGQRDLIARPAGGYLWDRAREAGVTYRSYGEWIENGAMKKDGSFEDGKARVKALEGHFDPQFRGYDLDYPDVKRAERFLSEMRRYEKDGGMPQLSILRLPNDHTSGTRVGKLTPTAMVADNDLALGLLVEGFSKSKFWKEGAIFVIEDDAQNGPDHVDCHRSVAYVISPYAKRGAVDSTMYSTSSMLRTMELILGLKPMSQFDAAARPMYGSFQPRPDFTPYTHVKPDTDMGARNKKDAWGAEASAKMNLEVEDAADDLAFNEIIWRSVRGPESPMPAPVRAGFFVPKYKVK
jgi:DNA-binding beta-propeller fold protein YncE